MLTNNKQGTKRCKQKGSHIDGPLMGINGPVLHGIRVEESVGGEGKTEWTGMM